MEKKTLKGGVVMACYTFDVVSGIFNGTEEVLLYAAF